MKLDEVERTELEFREGSSDKVYTAIMYKDEDGGYRVLFKYGSRYNAHNRNDKHFYEGVPYGEALGIYHEMIDKKRKKGYVDKNY